MGHHGALSRDALLYYAGQSAELLRDFLARQHRHPGEEIPVDVAFESYHLLVQQAPHLLSAFDALLAPAEADSTGEGE